MKHVLFFILILGSLSCDDQPSVTGKIYFRGMGDIYVSLMDVQHFLKEPNLGLVITPDEEDFRLGFVEFQFHDFPAGKYALMAYQDINGNEALDLSGQLPIEPFAFFNYKPEYGYPAFLALAQDIEGPLREADLTLGHPEL